MKRWKAVLAVFIASLVASCAGGGAVAAANLLTK